ncbi:hypothetical protein [Erythrobacter sp.]|uniref:hypothetical protein n=1 Tax=Erythrobacter sp. TaxID=1042 RepID=UPI003C77248D
MGRAYNDDPQIAIEAGAPGLLLVAAGVQFDRQTLRAPALAGSIPTLFRYWTQARIAVTTPRDDNPKARSKRRELVRRRPIPAERLRLLSREQFAAELTGYAALTIQYAAGRGWRDPLGQNTMLILALEAGDEAEAARRFTALLFCRGSDNASLEAVAANLFSEAGGQSPRHHSRDPSRCRAAAGSVAPPHFAILPPEAFVENIEEMAWREATFNCGALQQTLRQIAGRFPGSERSLSSIVEASC